MFISIFHQELRSSELKSDILNLVTAVGAAAVVSVAVITVVVVSAVIIKNFVQIATTVDYRPPSLATVDGLPPSLATATTVTRNLSNECTGLISSFKF